MATSPRALEVHSSHAETAAATMTSHPSTTTQVPHGHKHTPTFLGLPAELRNIIYSCVFTTMVDSSPKPHALTGVNKQIRRESRGMYYSSVTQLDILICTLEDIRRARKWLAEEDMRLYPVFPDIRLFLPTYYQPMVSISCVRKQAKQADISQAVRNSLRVSGQGSGEGEWDWAMFEAYDSSLGVLIWRLASTTGPTERFIEAAQGNATWIYREVTRTCDDNPFEGPLGYSEERQRLGDMFTRLAVDKDGHDWDEGDLGRVVGFFERGLGRVKVLDS